MYSNETELPGLHGRLYSCACGGRRMALDCKKLISETLLDISKTKKLRKITVTDIQRMSGISRQTFLNYFIDINDLIQYTYKKNIVIQWDPCDENLDYCDYLIEDLEKTREYHHFLKDALEIHGQNNLEEYMNGYCADFFQGWMEMYYPEKEVPEHLRYAVIYAAAGGNASEAEMDCQ